MPAARRSLPTDVIFYLAGARAAANRRAGRQLWHAGLHAHASARAGYRLASALEQDARRCALGAAPMGGSYTDVDDAEPAAAAACEMLAAELGAAASDAARVTLARGGQLCLLLAYTTPRPTDHCEAGHVSGAV
eukprot:SAG11_NODE_294_length_11142_cov_7.050439_13_plen_134_part_00